jgi:hypothetical protein
VRFRAAFLARSLAGLAASVVTAANLTVATGAFCGLKSIEEDDEDVDDGDEGNGGETGRDVLAAQPSSSRGL